MKIFIIGNISSGKTYLAKYIAELIDYPVLSINEFRIKFNNFATLDGEILTWDLFKKYVQHTPYCIIESAGTSKHYESLIAMNPNHFVIKIEATEDECLNNYLNRDTLIPMPYDFDIKESIHRNHTILKNKDAHLIYNRNNEAQFWDIFHNVLKPCLPTAVSLQKKEDVLPIHRVNRSQSKSKRQ